MKTRLPRLIGGCGLSSTPALLVLLLPMLLLSMLASPTTATHADVHKDEPAGNVDILKVLGSAMPSTNGRRLVQSGSGSLCSDRYGAETAACAEQPSTRAACRQAAVRNYQRCMRNTPANQRGSSPTAQALTGEPPLAQNLVDNAALDPDFLAKLAAAVAARLKNQTAADSACSLCGIGSNGALSFLAKPPNFPNLELPGDGILFGSGDTSMSNIVGGTVSDVVEGVCGTLPLYTLGAIKAGEVKGLLGFSDAGCNNLPLPDPTDTNRDKKYLVLRRGGFSAGQQYSLCAALRPCSEAGHEYLFGFKGLQAQWSVAPGVFVTASLFAIGWTANGDNAVRSRFPMLFLDTNAVEGRLDYATVPSHLTVRAGMSLIIGNPKESSQDTVRCIEEPKCQKQAGDPSTVRFSFNGDGVMSLNLDPRRDGFGGTDHEFMLETVVSPRIEISTVLTLQLGNIATGVHWKVEGDGRYNFQLNAIREADLTLGGLLTSIGGPLDIFGKLKGLFNDLPLSASIGAYVTVTHESWAIRVEFRAGGDGLRLNADRAKEAGIDPNKVNAGAGLVVRGNAKTGVAVGFMLGSSWTVIDFCSNDDHSQCVGDAACFGFICVPKKDYGGFCTHDVHCKSGHCGDEKGMLTCGDCTQDEHCPKGSFCEVNPLQALLPGGFPVLKCRPGLGVSAGCDRDRACASGRCSGGIRRCTECDRDEDCPGDKFCELNNFRGDANACRSRQGTGGDCDRDRACQSNRCRNFRCAECDRDEDCPGDKFCEGNLFTGASLNTCRGCLGRGSSCDRERACCSRKCGFDLLRLPFSNSCE